MTDKLKELVARMRHAVANPMKTWSAGEVIAADKVDFWADELEALLAEQAPAGEWNAKAFILERWHNKNLSLEQIVAEAYAAGRSSQPVEQRDPAGKLGSRRSLEAD